MVTPQQRANAALAEWQQIRELPAQDRLTRLIKKDLVTPTAADLAYAEVERVLLEIMENA